MADTPQQDPHRSGAPIGGADQRAGRWQPGPVAPTWQPVPAERDVPHPLSTSAFEPLTPPELWRPADVPTQPDPPVVPAEPASPLATGYVPFSAPLVKGAPLASYPAGGRTRSRWVTWAVLTVGLLIVVALGIGLLVAMRSALAEQQSVDSDAEVRAALLAAGLATGAFARENGVYPTDVAQLAPYGFGEVPGVDVRILRTGGALTDPPILDFCLGAGPSSGAPTLYYQPGNLVSSTPCA